MKRITNGTGTLAPGAVASPDLGAAYNVHRDQVLAAIAAGARDFDAVRAALQLDVDALPDGHVHQIALDAGYVAAP